MRHHLRLFWIAALAIVTAALLSVGQGVRADQRSADSALATPTPSIIEGGDIVLDENITDKFTAKEPVIFAYAYIGAKDEKLKFTLESGKGLKTQLTIFTPDKSNFRFDGNKTDKTIIVDSAKTGNLVVTLPGKGRYIVGITNVGATGGTFTLGVTAMTGNSVGNADIEDENFPAEIVPKGAPKVVVKQFADAGLVPTGGRQLLTIPDSFGTSSDAGFGFLRLGRGTMIKNMVLQFEMGWSRAGEDSGCGMVFRAVNNDLKNFWYAMLTNDKKIRLVHTVDKEFPVEVIKDSENFTPDRYNYVTLVVIDDKVAMYVNGALEAVKITSGKVDKGVFAIQIYNNEDAVKRETTDCRYQNIWAWSYD